MPPRTIPVTLLLAAAAVAVVNPASSDADCFGSWTKAPDYLVGQSIDRAFSDQPMTVSVNACVNYNNPNYVTVANPNGTIGRAPHLR